MKGLLDQLKKEIKLSTCNGCYSTARAIKLIVQIFEELEKQRIGTVKPEEFVANRYEVYSAGVFSIMDLKSHLLLKSSFNTTMMFASEDHAKDLCEALNIGHKLRMKREGIENLKLTQIWTGHGIKPDMSVCIAKLQDIKNSDFVSTTLCGDIRGNRWSRRRLSDVTCKECVNIYVNLTAMGKNYEREKIS